MNDASSARSAPDMRAVLETADVALMADDLAHLPFAVGLSRQTRWIIRQNLVVSLGVVALLLLIVAAARPQRGLALTYVPEQGIDLVVALDVSGSMADYSRNLLQLAYSARRAQQKVEVFCFGTRLTRISKSLDRRSPDAAMALAGASVLDWDGGTKIGDSISSFVRRWGRAGMSRGAIVVICSDALDRGDPAVLAEAMAALARTSHRVLWMNPHKGDTRNFEPNTMGMVIAAPFVAEIVSGHNLRSLEEFSKLLTSLR